MYACAIIIPITLSFIITGDIPSFEEHLHSLFTVVHVGPLATGIQSLMLLFQVMESRSSVSGRYYQALYAKLMDPALKHSGKQVGFEGMEGLEPSLLDVSSGSSEFYYIQYSATKNR